MERDINNNGVDRSRTFIIAEAGVNHNGDINIAKGMIEAAIDIGADAIKFQSYVTDELTIPLAQTAPYQRLNTNESVQRTMLKKLELSENDQVILHDYALKKNIEFISSPFDIQSLALLVNLGLNIIKIPSGEITNIPLLRKISSLDREVILSTGMSSVKEIEYAVKVLLSNNLPKSKIWLLHCNTEYPTPFEDVNLRAMLSLREIFNVYVGYSDHTVGIDVSLAAVAMGASIIEKHFTLDKNSDGPDHSASLSVDEFKLMIKKIRDLEIILGEDRKYMTKSEEANKMIVRKSIVARTNIRKGEVFTSDLLTVKRPLSGVCASKWDTYIGEKASRDYEKNEFIDKL